MALVVSPAHGVSIGFLDVCSPFPFDGDIHYEVRSGCRYLHVIVSSNTAYAANWCYRTLLKHQHGPYRARPLAVSVCDFPTSGMTSVTALCAFGTDEVLIVGSPIPSYVKNLLLSEIVRPVWLEDLQSLASPGGPAHGLVGMGVAGRVVPIHLIYERVFSRPVTEVPQRSLSWPGDARDRFGILYAAHMAHLVREVAGDFLGRGWI